MAANQAGLGCVEDAHFNTALASLNNIPDLEACMECKAGSLQS
jgi:hypothetical protein